MKYSGASLLFATPSCYAETYLVFQCVTGKGEKGTGKSYLEVIDPN